MTDDEPDGSYSAVADSQLDELQASDPALYNDILTVCELVFADPSRAQSMSSAVQTADGIVLRLAVPGRAPYKVFWTTAGPRVEAVFPHLLSLVDDPVIDLPAAWTTADTGAMPPWERLVRDGRDAH